MRGAEFNRRARRQEWLAAGIRRTEWSIRRGALRLRFLALLLRLVELRHRERAGVGDQG